MLNCKEYLIMAMLVIVSLTACQATKPVIQTSQPVVIIDEDIDSDNDGVLDSKDYCLNTPLNVVVDVKGCPVAPTTDSDIEPVFRLFFPKNQNYPYDDYTSLTQNPETLRKNMLKPLKEPLAYLKNHSEKSICLSIEGHSSKGKNGDTVKDIDLQRALTVKQMYKKWFGFKEENIKVEHYGSERPIAPSDTPAHTAMNQRAFIRWYGCRKTK